MFIVVSYDPFNFCGISFNHSSFISDFIFESSCFLSIVKGLPIFVTFQKPVCSFLDFFYFSGLSFISSLANVWLSLFFFF